MKMIVSLVLVLILLFGLTACGKTYNGPLSCITHNSFDGQVILMDMTEDVHKEILSLMNKGEWIDAMPNCGQDYEFEVDGATTRYHSDCGTFYDSSRGYSLNLSDEDKMTVNQLLGVIE